MRPSCAQEILTLEIPLYLIIYGAITTPHTRCMFCHSIAFWISPCFNSFTAFLKPLYELNSWTDGEMCVGGVICNWCIEDKRLYILCKRGHLQLMAIQTIEIHCRCCLYAVTILISIIQFKIMLFSKQAKHNFWSISFMCYRIFF